MKGMREGTFRRGSVDPFLKTLSNTHAESIQQVAIRGTPDKLMCISGKYVAMELKRDGEVPTALQALFLDKVERAGGIALVARPSNWPLVKIILEALANGFQTEVPPWREQLSWKISP
jgi:hypothetical protein